MIYCVSMKGGNKLNSKLSLYNRIKEFIYSPELEDLNVFSKQYYNTIIKPSFSSNTKFDNYSMICIDFNKLNDINTIYGYEIGNQVVHKTISLIKSVLPTNSVCARIGGDEFLFLIDNCSIELSNELINKIYSILDIHKNEICFSSVCAHSVHCSQKDSLDEMLSEADLKITEQKNNFNNTIACSDWDILEKKLTQNLTSFFKGLRLYNYQISTSFLKKLYLHAINSSKDLLEKDFSFTNDDLNQINYNPTIPKDKILDMYNLFLNENPTLEDIYNIDDDTYSSVLEKLIKDPITGEFSKDYFLKYILNDYRKTFKIKYISTTFVKLYNTLFSHNITDMKLREMVDDFIFFLEKQNIYLTQNKFSEEKENYFIALGAGDYLLAFPSETPVDNDLINLYIKFQNHMPSHLSDILCFVCNPDFKTVNKDNFNQVINQLSTEGKLLKNVYKEDLISEPIIADALNRIIYDSAEYYITNIPDCNDIKQKSKFINLLSNCMLNVSYSLNEKQKNNFNKDDENR